MFGWLLTLMYKAWNALFVKAPVENLVQEDEDGSWSRDFKTRFGFASYSVFQGRNLEESHELSHVEIQHDHTVIGLYDGHGGRHAAEYLRTHMLTIIDGLVAENHGTITESILERAIYKVEEDFTHTVQNQKLHNPQICASGSSCLTAVINDQILHVSSVGNSRALLGFNPRLKFFKKFDQLSVDQDVNVQEIREDVIRLNPGDVVVTRDPSDLTWRILGKVKVSECVGDLYLKNPNYAVPDPQSPFFLEKEITRPILGCTPSLKTRNLKMKDKFLVVASDGLWVLLSNEKVVQIVNDNRREGIAKKLIAEAKKVALEKEKEALSSGGAFVPDDMSVIVFFFERKSKEHIQERSIEAFGRDDEASTSGVDAGNV